MDFHNTGYGRKYFEHQLPEQIKAMNRLAAAMEENNRLIKLQLDTKVEVENKKSKPYDATEDLEKQ